MEDIEFKRALSEVSQIFAHLEKPLFDKIPAEYKNFVERNKDAGYTPRLDLSKPLEYQVSKKAIAFLAILRYNEFSKDEQDKRNFLERINKN